MARYLSVRVLLGLITIAGVVLLTFTLHPAQLLIGVMRVPLGRNIAGTLLGFAPTVAFDVWFGGELLRRLLAWLGLG